MVIAFLILFFRTVPVIGRSVLRQGARSKSDDQIGFSGVSEILLSGQEPGKTVGNLCIHSQLIIRS
jgi:hypothetical protein